MSITASHELTSETTIGRPGRLILLNGTSSSGKSSIAEELLATLDGAWFHLAIDQFHRIRARREWTDETFLPVFQRTVLGFHRAVAGMASAGNDVVVDHILGERWRLADCLTVFAGLPVLFVGVRCSLPELERRERERGNRTVGRAAVQFPLVHQHDRYDVEVDSEHHTPAECATQIRTRLNQGLPTAFDELRSAHGLLAVD
ncbi:chloramphenicol phosphotransferase CPT family protein [Kribbella sp. NBC_00709]|uniref:chloramphenicol phosphotransferase CPT family protein n=1 Tax=Kribbella sp. NBC_00709 TaxID=2975972 RepID=UPI002E2D5CDF|nr:AAA family ATPase [Kribbella sp. NBC_00709]